jgi:glutaredoxin/glutathione-dependent peroxiredoxin
MKIKTGERLPRATFKTIGPTGIVDVTTDALLTGKKVVLFGLPGAYTPVCSAKHLPGYVENAARLRAEGFTDIACVSVNDPFVMAAWGKEHGATDKVTMLCDVDGSFTRAIGLVADLAQYGLPGRSERYSMVVDDGVVKKLEVEKTVFDHDLTSAACMLRG